MKIPITFRFIPIGAATILVAVVMSACASSAYATIPPAGTNEDFSAVSNAVVELLKSRDTARFATNLAATFGELQSAVTNVDDQSSDSIAIKMEHIVENGLLKARSRVK